jgi:hypothetical protein
VKDSDSDSDIDSGDAGSEPESTPGEGPPFPVHPIVEVLYRQFSLDGGRFRPEYLVDLREKLTTEAESAVEVFEALEGTAVFMAIARQQGDEAAVLTLFEWIQSFEPYFKEQDEKVPALSKLSLPGPREPLRAPGVDDKPKKGSLSLRKLIPPPKKIR